ncbi:hypothetical protein BJ973_005666 [Actinoplanes tereljensis]|uniref:Parallel beta helix pectate lyase-like protein n=1 Tax=Paractinoplanes tereljensis TaxID=571912 RepID=A0A919NZT4_9ACTN|nr:right-handed parallel beta-helix repeat-containing protein [Actinoplanes tereljensis]GIF26307.1 hypothetical protein Ate02nite_90370 [Actinoplanes tereljensis]
MAISRRHMLTAGAAGLTAAGLAGATPAVAAAPSGGPWTPAADLGLAPGNSAAANRAALVAGLSNSGVSVYFGDGDYQLDNSGTDIVIPSFTGVLAMAPAARFVFTDSAGRGLEFKAGTGARFYGLSTAFVTAPAARVGAQECVLISLTTDTYVEDVTITGSAAAGLLFYRCTRPTVVGALITGTMADGLHFANCQDGSAERITTIDTGDDGVAFVNYADGPASTGGRATHLSITRSKARGIAVVGQSRVTIRDAVVDTTSSAGVYCARESGEWVTRKPDDVTFQRIRIVGAGLSTPVTSSGLRITGAGRVVASDITIDQPGAHGVHAQGNDAVTLLDMVATNTPQSGFLMQEGTYSVDRLTAQETFGIGVNATGCTRFEYGTITAINAAKTHATHRALNVENVTRVFGNRVWIIDTQATATGYVAGAYGTQKGNLGTLVVQVDHGTFTVDNQSGLTYTRA